MRRLLVMLLVILISLTPMVSLAEAPSDWEAVLAEKDQKIASLEAQIAELQAQIMRLTATPEPEPEPTPAAYATLKKGSKGKAVAALQERLKELGYLGGAADGSFGGGTGSAVKEFQKAAGLKETGEADAETQELLFSDAAPESPNPVVDETVYEKLDYKANSRDPDAYTGKKIKFSGRILQVMEDDGYAVFRIATKGNYDNVVYAIYVIPENYKRILEDDKVNVFATSTGIYTYETIMGGSVTIPSCVIDRIEIK